MLEGIS